MYGPELSLALWFKQCSTVGWGQGESSEGEAEVEKDACKKKAPHQRLMLTYSQGIF